MNNDDSFVVSKSAVLALMDIKGDARSATFHPKRDRFNMPHSADTQVREDLNANRIMINDSYMAIATQFPFIHQLEAQFQMMVDNRTPALIILASHADMEKNELPEYFSRDINFRNMQTRSTRTHHVDLGDSIEAKVYQLDILGYQTPIDLPVIHVHNWPDHQTVSPKTTAKLVDLIETTVAEKRAFYETRKSRAVSDPEKILPVIHCRAGVGRTGQTIAAMAMKRYPELSLEDITRDLRASRNDYMIQTPVQMETLLKMKNSNQQDI